MTSKKNNDEAFLYVNLKNNQIDIYISGYSMDLLLIYSENKKNNIYKVYLFKCYSFNIINYEVIYLTESFKKIHQKIAQQKFKKYCFYNPNIKNIAIKLLKLYEYDDFIYMKTLKKAYEIALSLFNSLIVDYENKEYISSLKYLNKNILETIYINEIINIGEKEKIILK